MNVVPNSSLEPETTIIGRKRTFRDFKEAIDEGLQPLEVAERGVPQLQTYCQYRAGFEAYFEYIRSKKIRQDRSVPEVHVLIGDPGTGKTRYRIRYLDIRYLDNWFYGILITGLDSLDGRKCPAHPLEVSGSSQEKIALATLSLLTMLVLRKFPKLRNFLSGLTDTRSSSIRKEDTCGLSQK